MIYMCLDLFVNLNFVMPFFRYFQMIREHSYMVYIISSLIFSDPIEKIVSIMHFFAPSTAVL